MRSFKIFNITLIMLCLSFSAIAQNTDLPGPAANVQTLPAGSLIIGMDNTTQATPGYFNLRAYGLAVTLMWSDKRLRWVITAGKAKDGIDITVPATNITVPTVVTATSKMTIANGSNLATVSNISGTLVVGMMVSGQNAFPAGTTIASIVDATHITLNTNATANLTDKNVNYSINTFPTLNYNFKAGPLVIFPQDTAGVLALINTFNSSLATNEKVNVYRTTAATTADIRYDLAGAKPKAAIMNDGGKASIHVGYMESALIPSYAYAVRVTPVGFFAECVTFVSEPHNDATIGSPALNQIVDSIRVFVQRDGGNFLAECAAIRPYENSVNARFHYSLGVADVNRNVAPASNAYPNPDLSMTQFEGQFDMADGGSLYNWRKTPSSSPNNNVWIGVKESSGTTDTIGFATSKMDANKKGGLVTYLGNHEFGNNTQIGVNGIRVYMNAFITPARYPACPPSGPLAVKFVDFKAQKVNNNLVKLTWKTGSEINSKEFIIERSSNGVNFYEIGRVSAVGNSNTYQSYTMNDNTPVKGKNFYRITEMDISGNKAFSATVYVNLNSDGTIKLEVYPNPASKLITINTENSTSFTHTLQVFDMAGRLFKNNSFNGNSIKLDVSNLQSGNYIIRITTSEGEAVQSKLVIARDK